MLIVRPANWINLPEADNHATRANAHTAGAAGDTAGTERGQGQGGVDVINAVSHTAALETEKDVRNAATRAALALDVDAESAAALVDQLHTPTKKHDPNFAAEPFVSFEYDDDAFGVNAESDDMSLMSYDSGLSYSLAGAGDGGDHYHNTEENDQKNKVKWI
jgi:hypothetical protein